MTLEEIQALVGTTIAWRDPDNGACSTVFMLRSAEGSDEHVIARGDGGDFIEGPASEFYPELLVCFDCGTDRIHTAHWLDANTLTMIPHVDPAVDNPFCEKCQDHCAITTLSEFVARAR